MDTWWLDGPGEVRVRCTVGEQPTEPRNDGAEVETVAASHEGVRGFADREQSDAAAWADHPVCLGEERVEVDYVAQREATGCPVDGGVAQRHPRHVGADQGRARRAGCEHPARHVGSDRDVSHAGEVTAEVAGATGEIGHDRAGRQRQVTHAPPPPTDVEPEGHDAVDEVVAGRDPVEHRRDQAGLVVSGREFAADGVGGGVAHLNQIRW
jgi:hypothetical protein